VVPIGFINGAYRAPCREAAHSAIGLHPGGVCVISLPMHPLRLLMVFDV